MRAPPAAGVVAPTRCAAPPGLSLETSGCGGEALGRVACSFGLRGRGGGGTPAPAGPTRAGPSAVVRPPRPCLRRAWFGGQPGALLCGVGGPLRVRPCSSQPPGLCSGVQAQRLCPSPAPK